LFILYYPAPALRRLSPPREDKALKSDSKAGSAPVEPFLSLSFAFWSLRYLFDLKLLMLLVELSTCAALAACCDVAGRPDALAPYGGGKYCPFFEEGDTISLM